MARKGINSTHKVYYGRARTTRRRLLIGLLVFIVLLLAAVVGFFFLQEYIVATPEGFRFEFPFSQPAGGAEDPASSPTARQMPRRTRPVRRMSPQRRRNRKKSRNPLPRPSKGISPRWATPITALSC